MRSYNSGNNNGNKSRNTSSSVSPYCKVCYDAGLPAEKYNSHYVKDQPGPNGKVVCPTLISQKCLICGVPGHTSRYCPDNSSTTSSSTVPDDRPRYAVADDEIRLPKIQRAPFHTAPHIAPRIAPRIVYPTLETKQNLDSKRIEFPALPGKFNASARFQNDEPLQKRRPAEVSEASPVHSPLTTRVRVKYNKKNNPFGDLHQSDSEGGEEQQKQAPQKKVQLLPPIAAAPPSSSSSSSWASVAGAAKTTSTTTTTTTTTATAKQQQQRSRSRFSIVVPTAISAPPLPLRPIVFKARVAPAGGEKKEQVKKLWGDTDSEDDEEFLKRGLE
jgi:hypothetical protein